MFRKRAVKCTAEVLQDAPGVHCFQAAAHDSRTGRRSWMQAAMMQARKTSDGGKQCSRSRYVVEVRLENACGVVARFLCSVA
jgi:hypothetical protein